MHTEISDSQHARKQVPRRKARNLKSKSAAPKRQNKNTKTTQLNTNKSKNINLRVDIETQLIIDRAAELNSQTRSEFMLSVARERALEVLLDRSYFMLDDESWDVFAASLDDVPKSNAKLKTLLREEAVWEKKSL